ncbi:hypothetical protein D4764_19G0000010, partial [Takifugu flavidus]
MFFDFSSAFNTIQPRLLRAKLEKMQMDAPLVSWIEDYLTGRPQFVRLQSCVSDPLMSNTGAPQGTVLSPFLFTTYTADFQYHSETCHLQKYSDDTVIVGCVENGQEDEYRDLVESFVRWSRENLLQLNVTKTKEMVVDFRKSKSPPSPVCISGKEVELVPSYRFLGVQLDNKLEWSTNTDAVYKKAMSRLYFLRRLRSFSVCSRMLQMFYQSVMASTIFFAAVCWGAGIKAKDANRLNKLIKKAGSVVGCRLDNLDEVVRDRMVLKLRTIMDSPSHPLHNTVDKLRSSFSNRLLQPRCSKERERFSYNIFYKECCSCSCYSRGSEDSHLARDCKSTVKCAECDRTSHDTVMHPGPPPQTYKAPPPVQDDGGEGEHTSNEVEMTSSCTAVCGPVAVYGLRKAIQAGAKDYGTDTVNFVERHFYVDDGLISVPSPAEAIDLLQRTQASLAESNLHLHKFASNSQAVMEAFCPEDCAAALKDLDLGGEEAQSQRSLGLIWETKEDTFTFSAYWHQLQFKDELDQHLDAVHFYSDMDEMTQARHVILKETQMATFEKELSALRANKPMPRQSPLLKLSPVLVNGLIAVGGRLKHSEVDSSEKNPIVIPKDSYISLLLTRHYHEQDKVHLTHEVLCTAMAEVTAIINARPLLPVSSDPENPFILSPSMLLTQKSCLPPPPGTFLDKDLYTKQWRQ